MRFLHAADLHLDSPLRAQSLRNPDLAARLRVASRTVLSRIVDTAIDARVDALLLAGDVFDSGVVDVAARAALAADLGRLARAGIPTVVIRGNHDALLDLERYGPVADGVTLLHADRPTIHVGDAAIHGLGFTTRHLGESLLPRYPAPEPARINVGLMHTSLDGSPGHDPYAPCSAADLLAHGYDYWALGHVHQRSELRGDRALAVMPGIPQGRSIREVGGGSVTLAEIGEGGVRARAVPVALLRFATLRVNLADAGTDADRIARFETALRDAAPGDAALAARVTVTGAGVLAGDPDHVRALLDEAASLVPDTYAEAVRFAPDPDRAPPGIVADLAEMMAADAATPGFRDEAAAALDDLRRALPPAIADTLGPDTLDALIAEGIETTAMRLAAGQSDA